MEVRRTVIVTHSARRMFDLIEQAERYPDFLPWCAAVAIVRRDPGEVAADITFDYHGVRFHFRTRNPKRAPEWMAIHLEHGPFHDFFGEWQLVPLGVDGCRIQFLLRYEFKRSIANRLAGPVFERIAGTMVDAFVHRADQIYAGLPPDGLPADGLPADGLPADGLPPNGLPADRVPVERVEPSGAGGSAAVGTGASPAVITRFPAGAAGESLRSET